jgi:hypothetical protein
MKRLIKIGRLYNLINQVIGNYTMEPIVLTEKIPKAQL